MKWTKKDSCKTVSDVITRNTGMSEEELNKVYNTQITNLQKAADRLVEIAKANKTVTVFADYDCDGICSAIILNMILHHLGIKFKVMFPKRSTGYGLQPRDVDNIESDVIITIDNGIAAFEGITSAKDKGIEVIVIDHHLKPVEGVPDADIIIDPHVFKESPDDFEDWCGAGLGYELSRITCSEEVANACLQFAAIATVADVVSLTKDNRRILKEGLDLLNHTEIPSLQNFLNAVNGGYGKPFVDENMIGFKIGPIINAMGRIEDNAGYVYQYFISNNSIMFQHMYLINEKRKALVASAVDRAYAIIAEECMFSDVPIIIYDPATPDGIVGVVAGRLAENLNVPVICLTDSEEEGIVKGSARSPNIHIKETLDKVKDDLIHYGGHAGAAGLSLRKDKIEDLRMRFSEIFADYQAEANDEIVYDLEIKTDEIGEVMNELKKYAPFGEGNPNPVFKVCDFKLLPRNGKFFSFLGTDASTIKFFGNNCCAIGFDLASKYGTLGNPKTINIVGKISENHFSRTEIQIEITDFESVNSETEKSSLAKTLASKLALDGF